MRGHRARGAVCDRGSTWRQGTWLDSHTPGDSLGPGCWPKGLEAGASGSVAGPATATG